MAEGEPTEQPEQPETPPNRVRVAHIADAYLTVARVNHYLIAVVDPAGRIPTPELEAAKQILIDRQNALPEAKGQSYQALDRALDLIEYELITVRRNG